MARILYKFPDSDKYLTIDCVLSGSSFFIEYVDTDPDIKVNVTLDELSEILYGRYEILDKCVANYFPIEEEIEPKRKRRRIGFS